MDYQLVLQFRGESRRIFDRLEPLEPRVKDMLGDTESFDGMDAGAHGANLFLYTDDPRRAFERLRPLLQQAELASGFVAAYRTVGREQFRVLWPAEFTLAFSLR